MRKMLIVDDEETIRWALAELFMQDGWEVHGAADGVEAAEMVAANVYDYMITDLKMPGRTGTDVIREARRHNARMGITVLTGYASVETAAQAVRMRACDYVTKPCSISALKTRIDEFLQEADRLGRRNRPAGPPAQSDLDAFVAGGGTAVPLASASPNGCDAAAILDGLRALFLDLGFGPGRARDLTQSCVEAVAALSGGPGTRGGRAALLGGRVLVGVDCPGEPPAGLPVTLERLRARHDVHVELVHHAGGCTVVLSEAI